MTTKLVDDLMDLFGELADADTRQCLSGDLASVGAATLEVGERQEVVGVRARQTVRAAGLLNADR
jgi:hypothetical protein